MSYCLYFCYQLSVISVLQGMMTRLSDVRNGYTKLNVSAFSLYDNLSGSKILKKKEKS